MAAIKERTARGRKVAWTVIIYLIIAVALAWTLLPFIWMVKSSLTLDQELFKTDLSLFPQRVSWHNYQFVWKYTPFISYFINSVKVTFLATVLGLLVSICAGYSLARFKFRGAKIYGLCLLVIQMFPAVLIVVPLSMIMQQLGLANTHASLILIYATLTLPFSVLMLRSYFETIPKELEEAARVDGCSEIGALVKIVLPLCGPGIAAVSIYCFLFAWNEFLYALVFLQDGTLRTLPVALAAFLDEQGVRWGWMMAASSLTTCPVLILFIFMQRFFVKGLVTGAVKG